VSKAKTEGLENKKIDMVKTAACKILTGRDGNGLSGSCTGCSCF